jgi:predicted CopG family antitoxin
MGDDLLKNKIKTLVLKGFNKEEISKLLDIPEESIEINLSTDINLNSVEYYTELQKDLSKLVYQELGKKEGKDSNVILNAIKLQANLQEKKLFLGRMTGKSKVSKDYLWERDKEVEKLIKEGKTDEQIAKELDMHILSVRQSTDRNSLNIPEEWKEKMSPSVVVETKGLDKKRRMEILQQAFDENLKRNDVRKIVNEIKNEGR